MSRLATPDNLVRLLGGLLLALLTYQAKCLCDRVSCLERNQVQIMVALGIPPVAHKARKIYGTQAASAQGFANHGNHPAENSGGGP